MREECACEKRGKRECIAAAGVDSGNMGDTEGRAVGDLCVLFEKDMFGCDKVHDQNFEAEFGYNRAPEGGIEKQVTRPHWMKIDFWDRVAGRRGVKGGGDDQDRLEMKEA